MLVKEGTKWLFGLMRIEPGGYGLGQSTEARLIVIKQGFFFNHPSHNALIMAYMIELWFGSFFSKNNLPNPFFL